MNRTELADYLMDQVGSRRSVTLELTDGMRVTGFVQEYQMQHSDLDPTVGDGVTMHVLAGDVEVTFPLDRIAGVIQ